MEGRLARLSLQAIRATAALPYSDARVLARRLYSFGTIPRGPQYDRDFGPGDDPLAVLDLTSSGGARARLLQDYDASTHPGWLGFNRAGPGFGAALGFKLYASPRPEALVMAFPVLADVLARHEVRSFKVGRGITGLLRPDKIVAYFDNRRHLEAVASALSRALDGCPVQGVPFTAELAADGLLSWGIDRPTQAGQPAESWRSWVTERLAAAILAVRRPGQDPAGLVLAKLAAEGVENWISVSSPNRVRQ